MAKDIELYNDSFQNWKKYLTCKAQLIIADPPYNLGANAYASNPSWYVDGDNKKGESDKAGKTFFDTDNDFRPAEFMHFCSQMLVKEPKQTGKSPCMIIFCEFEQQFKYIELGRKYGFAHYINLVFRKNFSPQVLKANMKIVGNCEYGVLLYRDKLPKFNNDGAMIFNCFDFPRDNTTPKVHPCLPAGEKVFINNKWMNIEDVKIGDKSNYGIVIDTTSHDANVIVEINTEDGTVKATYNHPFLIKRNNEIAWCQADKITENDFILWRTGLNPCINKRKKDISDSEEEKPKWNMSSCGNNTLEKSPKDTKYTTLTEINQIIELKTCSLSLPLNTNGYTRVASLLKENGTNHVRYAENINHVHRNIGTLVERQSMDGYVKNAILTSLLRTEKFSLKKVGSVKIIHENQKVYNLTIQGIPAFDTVVGVSHNTQKPVPLLVRLIEIFTDPGDVVIDPCAGSGTTLLAAANCGRRAYGFEIKKDFYQKATNIVLKRIQHRIFI